MSQADAQQPKDDEAIESRSADPGQSSYGGFKNEGPSVQNEDRPADEAAEGGAQAAEADSSRAEAP